MASCPSQYIRRVYKLTDLLGEKKGPLVRIGPNELLSADPDVLRRMSAVRSLYTKGSFYESGRITPGVDNVVSMRDEEKHKEMRARMWTAVRVLPPYLNVSPN